jgi:hypothetical protein
MRVTCEKCKKATYAGCGRHVEQVLGDVPRDERCDCRAKAGTKGDTEATTPSLMRRIFGL